MAPETAETPADIQGPGTKELPTWQPFSPHQPDLTSGPCQVTPPGFLPPSQHQEEAKMRHCVLKELGASNIFMALLHLVLGSYLVSVVKNLHLVALKSWYPFWGAASFLISGALAVIMAIFRKKYLKVLCLTANFISFFCVLAGLFVMIKDLVLESPFEDPIWLPFPKFTVHIRRLELTLLCFTFVELFLLGLTTVMAWRVPLSAEMDTLSLIPDPPLALSEKWMEPPPSYEDVIQDHLEERL